MALRAASAAEKPVDHSAEVSAFARIMADVRTAVVCKGVSPNWTIVNAAKKRLHLGASCAKVADNGRRTMR